MYKFIKLLSASPQIWPSFTPSLPLQWWADPGRSAGQEGFLEEDVQVAECRQWHQQPIGAGHLRVHHRPLWDHHRPALPVQVPPHFSSQEAEAADRWERLRCKSLSLRLRSEASLSLDESVQCFCGNHFKIHLKQLKKKRKKHILIMFVLLKTHFDHDELKRPGSWQNPFLRKVTVS